MKEGNKTWLLIHMAVGAYDENADFCNDAGLDEEKPCLASYTVNRLLADVMQFDLLAWQPPNNGYLAAWEWFSDATDGDWYGYIVQPDPSNSAAAELFTSDIRPGDEYLILTRHAWYVSHDWESGIDEAEGQCEDTKMFLMRRPCGDAHWFNEVVPLLLPGIVLLKTA